MRKIKVGDTVVYGWIVGIVTDIHPDGFSVCVLNGSEYRCFKKGQIVMLRSAVSKYQGFVTIHNEQDTQIISNEKYLRKNARNDRTISQPILEK